MNLLYEDKNIVEYNNKLFKNIIKYASVNKDIMNLIKENKIVPDINIFNKVYEMQNLRAIINLKKKYGDKIDLFNDNVLLERAFKDGKNNIIKYYLLKSVKDKKIEKKIISQILNLDIDVDKEIIFEIISKYDNIIKNKEVQIYIKYNFNYLFKKQNY
jgi:hypothetical protein